MREFQGRGEGALRLLRRLVLGRGPRPARSRASDFQVTSRTCVSVSLTILVTEDLSRNIIPPVDMTASVLRRFGHGSRRRDILQELYRFSHHPAGARVRRLDDHGGRQERGEQDRDPGRGECAGRDRDHAGGRHHPEPGGRPGTLDLAVTWDPASVDSPSVQSQLVPSQGTPIDLAFTMPSPGEARYSNGAIPNGYYTLVVKLLDNGQLVMGAVDVVRIVAGETTSGAIDFTDVNQGTGTISVSITLQMNEPVQVTMSGHATELSTGHPMTVTASVPAGLGNATYVWYLNGVSVGMGSSITLNDSCEPADPENLPVGRVRLRFERVARAGRRPAPSRSFRRRHRRPSSGIPTPRPTWRDTGCMSALRAGSTVSRSRSASRRRTR